MDQQDVSVLNVSSRAFVEGCRVLGLDIEQLLYAVDVSHEALNTPHGRIPLSKARQLWVQASKMANTPHFVLDIAQAVPFGAYQIIDFLVASAPTLGAGLIQLATYLPLVNPSFDLNVYVEEDTQYFELSHSTSLPYAEFTLCVCYLHTQAAMGFDIDLRLVEFAFDAPVDTSHHREVFGCPVDFGATKTRFGIAHAKCARASENADRQLHMILEGFAKQKLVEYTEPSELQRIRDAIRTGLTGEVPTVQEVARQLGMTARTLQRRLQALDQTYSMLLDEQRQEVAFFQLGHRDASLAEVSYLLGFSDQSAFHRAFKRWSGLTPIQWQKQNRSSS